MSFSEIINSIISNVPLLIIAGILGLDSIRAVIASLGIVDPNSKFGRIVYGKRDRAIVRSALRDIGYSEETTDEIVIKMEPGCAFGTGTHQTTQLCMKALEKYLKNESN